MASSALSQVTLRLRANTFEREGALAAHPPVLPYVPMSLDMTDGSKYGNRDNQSRGRGNSYATGNLPGRDSYGSYGGSLVRHAFTSISSDSETSQCHILIK